MRDLRRDYRRLKDMDIAGIHSQGQSLLNQARFAEEYGGGISPDLASRVSRGVEEMLVARAVARERVFGSPDGHKVFTEAWGNLWDSPYVPSCKRMDRARGEDIRERRGIER